MFYRSIFKGLSILESSDEPALKILQIFCQNFSNFMMIQLCLFLVFLGAAAGKETPPSVVTTSGTLYGKTSKVLEHELKLFLGVPYGVPPIEDLRFKAPLPFTNPDGVLYTQKFKPICLQPPHVKSVISPLLNHSDEPKMDEDCLYLNLYVPEKTGEELPVMVWLSGEGFDYADPTQFDGSFLASTQKIIVVTVSYRVSVFGFLNGLSQDAPGNVGLWDQRLALKWVQKNIRAFGGNPDKVTLSGRFTGAMSTVIHAVSPLNKKEKLFQKIIIHSGVPDGKWIFNTNPLNAAMLMAEAMDCVFGNFSETLLCLKRVPADVLLKAGLSMQNEWRPSLDFSLISETSISDMMKEGDLNIDVLVGTNNNEGSLCLSALKVFNSTLYEIIVKDKLSEADYEQLIAAFLLDVYKESNKLVNEFVSFTYAVQDKSNLRNKFVNFCGDLYINSFSGRFEDILADSKNQVFVYELSHRPSFSIQPPFIEAGHGDDVLYSFGLPLQIQNLPQEEIQITTRILTAISNFVYHGNPNPLGKNEWPSYSESKMIWKFDTLPETADVVRSSHVNAVKFWQVIIPNMFSSICPPVSMTTALVDPKITTSSTPSLDNWMSVSAVKCTIVVLLCACALLLLSLVIALVVILRHTSSMSFQRLK